MGERDRGAARTRRSRAKPAARADAVVGVAGHNGWAILVSVARRDGVPVVLDRRRVELLGPGLPSQPFHHEALELEPLAAAALVGRVKASAAQQARAALSRLGQDLQPSHRLAAVAIREGPTPPIPDAVAAVLESRRATLAADGELYRRALCDAARGLGARVETYARGTEIAGADSALGGDASAFLAAAGRELGAPWQKDHRLAAAAAIAVLGRTARLRAVALAQG